jgi:hypothetical protein
MRPSLANGGVKLLHAVGQGRVGTQHRGDEVARSAPVPQPFEQRDRRRRRIAGPGG